MIDPALMELCAPTVARSTIEHVIRAESGGDSWAVNVNGIGRVMARSKAQAIAQAQLALAQGYTVDVGLMQINSQHFLQFHMTLTQAFDACTNIKVGAWLLTSSYQAAVAKYGAGQVALQHALSAYNTGNFERGLANGYVARYYTRRRPAPKIGMVEPDSSSFTGLEE